MGWARCSPTYIIYFNKNSVHEKQWQYGCYMYDLVIIGGGVSGLAAGIYSGRFLMKTALVAEVMGGTIISTDDIANYPGFKKISGLGLINQLQVHLRDYDVEMIYDRVTSLEKCQDGCFEISMTDGKLRTKSVILATGTEWRKLKAPGEEKFANRGVHYCALCDGPFYKNKVVGVVGGGDSAAKESLVLTQYAQKVYIINRGENIKPEPINLKRVMENDKIEIINNTNVLEIKGEERVDHVVFDRPYRGSKELKLNGLFIDIGHVPLSYLAKEIGVELNDQGEVITDRESKTNVDGFFAAGDVVDTRFKQAITGVAEGVTAAYSAYRYVTNKDIICFCDDQ